MERYGLWPALEIAPSILPPSRSADVNDLCIRSRNTLLNTWVLTEREDAYVSLMNMPISLIHTLHSVTFKCTNKCTNNASMHVLIIVPLRAHVIVTNTASHACKETILH